MRIYFNSGLAVLLFLCQLGCVSTQVPPISVSNCTGHAVILSNARWQETGADENCSDSFTWDAAARVNAALAREILQLRFGGSASCPAAEVCHSTRRVTLAQRQRWSVTTAFVNIEKEKELDWMLQFRAIMAGTGCAEARHPAFVTTPGHLDAASSTETGAAGSTIYRAGEADSVFTVGPSVFDLAETAYQFVTAQYWTYIVTVTSTNRGDQLLTDRLQRLAQNGSSRLCIGLALTIAENNATLTAEQLRSHTYSDKKLDRLSVLVAAPAEMVASLLELTSGSDVRFADTGRRYQWVLVGDSARYVGQLANNSTLGAVIIRPGIVDYHPASDFVASHLLNATLNWLAPSFAHCNWEDLESPCYSSALDYDRLLLSLLPVLSQAPEAWDNTTKLSALRNNSTDEHLSTYHSLMPYYRVFTDQEGYTRYSFGRGLYHPTRGYSAPAVKVYNVQLVSGGRRIVKVGEMVVDNNGVVARRNISIGAVKFYVFNEASGATSEVASAASQCQGACPECAPKLSGAVEFSPGEFYIGAIVPVHYKRTDRLRCTDGIFPRGILGSYQYAQAVKFLVSAVNHIGTSSIDPPQGFNESLMDQQFLSALKKVLDSVRRVRGQVPILGYIIVDSCYAGPYTSNNLNHLLSGLLSQDAPGFHYSRVIGFVGSLSSTCTMAASEILRYYSLPLISFASTSTALNSTSKYPFVARTVVTDRVIVLSLIQLLRLLGADYIAVVYANTEYGLSLRDQIFELATDNGICIGGALAHTIDDAEGNLHLVERVASLGARYVPFLGSLTDLANFVTSPETESAAAAMTFITTESVGTSTTWLDGRTQLGAGCLSVGINAGHSPAFAAHQRSLLEAPPDNPTVRWPPWLSAYFESARDCYLVDAYGRSTAYSRPCTAVSDLGGLDRLESRVQLVVDAASSLILGGLSAMNRICQLVTPASCDSQLLDSNYSGMQRRGNLVLFDSETGGPKAKPQRFGNYSKINEARIGSNELSIWQYQNQSGTGWDYVQIGSFSSEAGLSIRETRQSLQKGERVAAQAACSRRSGCGKAPVTCANALKATGGQPAAPANLLGLLALLFLPGLVLGYFGYHIWHQLFRKFRQSARAGMRSEEQRPSADTARGRSFEMNPIIDSSIIPHPQSLETPAPRPRQRQLTSASSSHGNASWGNNAPSTGNTSTNEYEDMSVVDTQQPLQDHPLRRSTPLGTYENDT